MMQLERVQIQWNTRLGNAPEGAKSNKTSGDASDLRYGREW